MTLRFSARTFVFLFVFFLHIPCFLGKQQANTPQQTTSAQKATAACAIRMMSDTEGVGFNFYLRDVYLSVRKRWFANMPPAAEKGQQGTNTVEFHILQDGTVPKDSIKMTVRSEKSDFDAASIEAIQEAAPLGHLPEKFTKPFIVLRFSFYYNLSAPKL